MADSNASTKPDANTSTASATSPIAINFAPVEVLVNIPGIKLKLAKAIVAVRESSGNITPEILSTISRRTFSEEVLNNIDFTLNRTLHEPDSDESPERSGDYHDSLLGAVEAEQQKGTWGADFMQLLSSAKRLILREKVAMEDNLANNLPDVPKTSVLTTKPLPTTLSSNAKSTSSVTTSTPVFGNAKVKTSEPTNLISNETMVTLLLSTVKGRPKPRLHFEEPQDENTGMVSNIEQSGIQRKDPLATLPKHLNYDGKGSWKAFFMQFQRYARTCTWTEEECLNCLCLSLKGKALEYLSIVSEGNEMNYQETLKKLRDRFDEQDIPATAQAKFMQSSQNMEEALEDWADRVLTMAVRAFKGLPETFATEQAVNKFCQGLVDKEAGEYVCNKAPGTVHQAIQMIRRYQQIHVSMYGKSRSEKLNAVNQMQFSSTNFNQQQDWQNATEDFEIRFRNFLDKLE